MLRQISRNRLFKPSRTPLLLRSLHLQSCLSLQTRPIAISSVKYDYNLLHPDRQQAYQNYFHPPKRNWPQIILSTFIVLGTTGYIAWYFFWPHHTFSKPVAKTLRKALWAESDKEDHNYKKALKLYVEALKVAEEEKLSPLSDEFTGIQIKIAEMYEKLGLNNEASLVYHEISDAYLAALSNDKVPIELRPHLVQKDLRAVLKFAHLNPDKPGYLKLYLLTHLLKAQEEILKRLGVENLEEIPNLFEGYKHEKIRPRITLPGDMNLVGKTEEGKSVSGQNFIGDIDFGNNIYETGVEHAHPVLVTYGDSFCMFYNQNIFHAFLPYRDEFFNARDLFVATCLSLGDQDLACRTQTSTTHWMMSAGCEILEIIKAFNNCGSLIYLTAEEYELEQFKFKSAKNEEAMKSARDQKMLLVRLAMSWYSVAKGTSQLILSAELRSRPDIVRESATSQYSLGVIMLHEGILDVAGKLLREARLRAKSAGYDQLVTECDTELAKLAKERQFRLLRGSNKSQEMEEEIGGMLEGKEIENVDLTFNLDRVERKKDKSLSFSL